MGWTCILIEVILETLKKAVNSKGPSIGLSIKCGYKTEIVS
jgi:hypothetical protein